jgi:prepilin-type N-terminal cleavage/methylation domain-containing protein
MRKGFTLIELLIVFSIVAIITTVTFNSYNRTRQSAELNIQIDNFVSDVREAKSESQEVCKGIQIKDKNIYLVQAEYQNPYSKCGQIQQSKKQSNLTVERIIRDEQVRPVENLTILFYPPRNQAFLPEIDQPGQASSENLRMEFSLGKVSNNQIVTFNSANASIQKAYKKDLIEADEEQ